MFKLSRVSFPFLQKKNLTTHFFLCLCVEGRGLSLFTHLGEVARRDNYDKRRGKNKVITEKIKREREKCEDLSGLRRPKHSVGVGGVKNPFL